MGTIVEEQDVKKKHKKHKKSKIISFDEEIITKSAGEVLLQNKDKVEAEKADREQAKKKKKQSNDMGNNKDTLEESNGVSTKKKKKKRDTSQNSVVDTEKMEPSLATDAAREGEGSPKKKKKRDSSQQQRDSVSKDPNTKNKGESIRARKRMKHAKLLEDKKVQADLAGQQKSLNYLSKWKHARSEWKFEKLRQVWLQQSIYDADKIPPEFWDILLEYFAGSKGKVRSDILKEAIKIIETSDEAGAGEESMKTQRARDVLQRLQE